MPLIRREALIALGHVGDASVAEEVGRLRSDPVELIQIIATELYERLKVRVIERVEQKEELPEFQPKEKKESKEESIPKIEPPSTTSRPLNETESFQDSL